MGDMSSNVYKRRIRWVALAASAVLVVGAGTGGPAAGATGAAPTVTVGADQVVNLGDTVFLPGQVIDDGAPDPSRLSVAWKRVSGPGTVTFGGTGEAHTSADFSVAGTYVLRLTASDGGGTATDDLTVTVRSAPSSVLRVPAEYPTIQSALDAAPRHALVLVSPGTYTESLKVSRTLTLASTFYTTGDRSRIGETVIRGASTDIETVTVTSAAGPDTRIVGFTVTGGKDGIKTRGQVVVSDNVLTGLLTDAVDFPRDAAGLVQHNVMHHNGDDGIDVNEASVVILDNEMRANDGDGIENRVTNMVAPVDEVVIRGNRLVDNKQDGLQIIDDDVTLTAPAQSATLFTVDRNVIAGNTQAGIGLMDGGKTSEDYRAASLVERITVTNNTFDGNNHGIAGGDNLVAVNNVFMRHTNIAVKNVDGASRVAHNQFFGNGQNHSGSNIDLATTYTGDPKLDSAHAPLAGSPVIDHGTASYTLPGGEPAVSVTDYQGAAPDLGAVESGFTGGGGGGTPTNVAPVVDAGADRSVTLPASLTLTGSASDDGLPTGSTLSVRWSTVSGPGTVSFASPTAASTSATFPAAGDYVLSLRATDGSLSSRDTVTVTVAPAVQTPPPAAQPVVQRGRVVAVVDGDTVDVRLFNGARKRVRMLGINAPARWSECGGVPARRSLARMLTRGTAVRIVTDPSQPLKDARGRLLRYVTKVATGVDVNRRQLVRGWARVEVRAGNPFARVTGYRAAQRAARAAGRGVWGRC